MHRTHHVRLERKLATLSKRFDEIIARQARIEEVLLRLATGRHLELLTTADVMHVLQVGRTKLHELIASGELPMWKLGGERRITRAEFEAFIQRTAEAP